MKYNIEQELEPVKSRYSSTPIPVEFAVFENGDKVKIDFIETMPKGKTLKDVMTLGNDRER